MFIQPKMLVYRFMWINMRALEPSKSEVNLARVCNVLEYSMTERGEEHVSFS